METSVSGLKERVLPVESIQLMFHYKKPFVFCNEGGADAPQPASVISGLSGSALDAKTTGVTGVIFVAFQPVGACCFFRFPLVEIRNCNISLADVDAREMRDTEDMLKEKSSDLERIAIVENFLLRRFNPLPVHEFSLLQHAVMHIKQQRGITQIHRLAQQLYATPRTLERKFTTFVGVSPKQYASLIRFQNILFDIKPGSSLTDVGYRYGYFDQAHFIRDFSSFSGYTPGEYLKLKAECNYIDMEFKP